jgi:hypothetical protein
MFSWRACPWLRCGARLWARRSGPLGPLGEPGTRLQGGGGGGCARALAVYTPMGKIRAVEKEVTRGEDLSAGMDLRVSRGGAIGRADMNALSKGSRRQEAPRPVSRRGKALGAAAKVVLPKWEVRKRSRSDWLWKKKKRGRGTHSTQSRRLPPVRCTSAGAERR